MSAPRIGIGLPVYNGAKYLREAVESLQAQTFSDFELVISDNASTDATEEICRELVLQDSRIRYVRSPENRGAARNFNRAFELSRGEYFKWLAHDDVIGPHYLQSTLDVLDDDASSVLCHAKTAIIDSRGELVADNGSDDIETWELQGTSREVEQLRLAEAGATSAARRFFGLLLHSVRCHEIFGLIRRRQMLKTGLHYPYCSGEKVLLAELSMLGRFRELPQIQSFSRWHADRFSSNSSAKAQVLHMDPNASGRLRLPRQFKSTWGYLRAILRSELSFVERARCLAALARFVLQPKKWLTIAQGYARGVGQLATLPDEPGSSADRALAARHWSSLSGVCSKGGV